MVDLALLQSVSYIAGALGVCVAASYYVMTLKNAEKERRKQTILQKLPAMSKEYYDCYHKLQRMADWTTRQEFIEKHGDDPEVYSMIGYIMNIYNTVGVLYEEGLMSLEDIIQLYTPLAIISVWERFDFMIPMNRLNSRGESSFPQYHLPFEKLYRELKRKYPGCEGWAKSDEERRERRRLREETIFSKLTPQ